MGTLSTNYSPQEITDLVGSYEGGVSVGDLALKLNRTPQSIIAKLVNLKVYIPKATAVKSDTKAGIATEIATLLGLGELESLLKCTKDDLKAIRDSVKSLVKQSPE